MADPRPVDPGGLERLERIGGSEFVTEMIELFLENAPERLRSAHEAYDGRDMKTLYRAVHSLKSTAANVGAQALREAAEAAEARAHEEDLDALGPLLDDLDRHYAQAKDELTAERDRRRAADGPTKEPQ